MKTAVAWWCFERTLGPEELVAAAVQGGYDGIELAPREEWQRVVNAGLTLASDRAMHRWRMGSTGERTTSRIEAEILKRLALAQEWGIPNLICFSGNRGGLDDETEQRTRPKVCAGWRRQRRTPASRWCWSC